MINSSLLTTIGVTNMRVMHFIFILFCSTTLLFAETIHFKKNSWNFVGFQNNINITKDPFLNSSRSQIVWTYENNSWNAFSSVSTIDNKLRENNFKRISKIKSSQGVWVFSNVAYNYIQTKAIAISKAITTSGWNLISSPNGTEIDAKQITNAQIVFVYRDNSWFAHFNNNSYNPYNILDTIKGTEAYWTYIADENLDSANNSKAISFPSLISDIAPPQPSI